MVSTTKKSAAVRKSTVELPVSVRERMGRHGADQRKVLFTAILNEAKKTPQFLEVLERFGVNLTGFTRWQKEFVE